jgi:hypothetical protein
MYVNRDQMVFLRLISDLFIISSGKPDNPDLSPHPPFSSADNPFHQPRDDTGQFVSLQTAFCQTSCQLPPAGVHTPPAVSIENTAAFLDGRHRGYFYRLHSSTSTTQTLHRRRNGFPVDGARTNVPAVHQL